MSGSYKDANEVIRSMANAKMIMNRHKGKIEDQHANQIIKMMNSEITELTAAIEDGNMLNIIEEAADVHNFLIALVHQQITYYRGRK